MTDGVNAAGAACVLCQQAVDMWSALIGGGTLPLPRSLPSSPSSPGPWFQLASSLLLFPVMARDRRLPPSVLLVSLFSISRQRFGPAPLHTGEAAWQPTAAAASLRRGMLLSLLVSPSVTVWHIQPKTPLLSSSSSLFLLRLWVEAGGGANKKGVCVVSSPLASTATQEGRDSRSAFSFSSSV